MSDTKPKRWSTSHPGPTREMVDVVLASDYDALEARIAELEVALGFYCDETNFKIVDEGRDYNTKNVLYEEDPQTYIKMPFGEIAREVLAKKGTP